MRCIIESPAGRGIYFPLLLEHSGRKNIDSILADRRVCEATPTKFAFLLLCDPTDGLHALLSVRALTYMCLRVQ
jgi:hypothetical protein